MDPAARPDLAPLFGGLQIGMALGLFCSGILALQTWNYYRTYPNDILLLRISVAVVLVGDLLYSIVLMHAVYHYTIISFGDYDAIQYFVWSLKASAILHGLMVWIVQLHFCRRIYYLQQSIILTLIAAFLSTCRFVFNACIFSTDLSSDQLSVLSTGRFQWQLLCQLGTGLAADLFIITCICSALLRQRHSGIMSTKSLVDKLVAFTVGSGVITTICTLLELTTYVSLRHRSYIFLLFYTLLGKLFANSLLASLNEREVNRNQFSLPSYPARIIVGTEISTTVESMELRPNSERKSFGYNRSKALEADSDLENGLNSPPIDQRGDIKDRSIRPLPPN